MKINFIVVNKDLGVELHTCIKENSLHIVLGMEITFAEIKEHSTTLNHSCRKEITLT